MASFPMPPSTTSPASARIKSCCGRRAGGRLPKLPSAGWAPMAHRRTPDASTTAPLRPCASRPTTCAASATPAQRSTPPRLPLHGAAGGPVKIHDSVTATRATSNSGKKGSSTRLKLYGVSKDMEDMEDVDIYSMEHLFMHVTPIYCSESFVSITDSLPLCIHPKFVMLLSLLILTINPPELQKIIEFPISLRHGIHDVAKLDSEIAGAIYDIQNLSPQH